METFTFLPQKVRKHSVLQQELEKIMIMLENLHITKSVTFLDKGVVCITIDLIGIRLLMLFATVM